MGRWGEEEKKTKGLFGCFVALGVLALFCTFAYRNYRTTENRRLLEKRVQDMVRSAYRKSEQEIKAEIFTIGHKLDIDLEADAVQVTRKKDPYGNYIVDVTVDYPLIIDFFIFERRLDVPIHEEVTLLEW